MPHRCIAWLAGLALALPALCLAATPDAPIAANVATLFIGEDKIVEGTVTAAEREGAVVHLRFGSSPQSLTVSLVIGLLSDFPPDPEHYYLGKPVRVAGTIRSFRDRPEIVIHDPANIKREDAALAAKDAPALREQVKTLNERVRTLENQVEQLKGAGTPQ